MGAIARRRVLHLLTCAAVATVFAFGEGRAQAEEAPTVAAAASLRYALDEIAAVFAKKTGQSVRITYGATGNLVHQIENGAPFQLLLAADEASVKRLAESGSTDWPPSVFATGRISLVAPKGSPVAVDGELKGLSEALAAGKVHHFAIANPEIAPYGEAAREALQKAGLWKDVEPRLVIGENIGQTAQFATTGAAEAGIIAHSLAISADIAPKVSAALIPADWHEPVNHGMAIVKGAGPTAVAFAEFVKGKEAAAILEKNGFSAPAH
jgi:molybdate transport system substrate-binding protein